MKMPQFNVPTREEVSEKNRTIFDALEGQLGFVPNLYATYAHSDNALASYTSFSQSQAKGSLSAREREVINLVVSQVNGCRYCQSAHTEIGKMTGFSDDEILLLRKGKSDDAKFDALVKLAKEITNTRGKPSEETVKRFFAAGYDKGGLIDVVLMVGDKTISNYVHNITQIPIDFPLAPDLSSEAGV
jgi:uncharacterized peroxidase-related enzyme